MEYIKKVGSMIDIFPFIEEIAEFNRITHLEHGFNGWELDTKRQENIPWHKHTKIIKLFDHVPEKGKHIMDVLETITVNGYPEKWPVARSFIRDIEFFYNTEVVLASYVLLPENQKIGLHPDIGKFFEAHDRYHLALNGTYTLRIGDEKIEVKPGDVFWFDNQEWHDVVDVSDKRVIMIFDTKPCERK